MILDSNENGILPNEDDFVIGGTHRFFDQNLGHIDDLEMKKALEEANQKMQQQTPTSEFKPDSIVTEIAGRFTDRAKMGWSKYGTDLDRTDLSVTAWIEHLQNEMHDAYLYSEKLRRDSEKRDRLLELCMHMLNVRAPRALNSEELTEFQNLRNWYNEQEEKTTDTVGSPIF